MVAVPGPPCVICRDCAAEVDRYLMGYTNL